jgi:Ca2+-binding EF-hand superfamily protein
MMSLMGCMAVALFIANAVQAQSQSVTAAAKAPARRAIQAQSADEADAIFARWDADHNGTLSLDEFRSGWHQLQAAMTLRRLHEQFVAMDTDKNGCLGAAEYSHLELIGSAGKSAPPMSIFDTEKNQCLDFKEYVNVVNYMLKHEHK